MWLAITRKPIRQESIMQRHEDERKDESEDIATHDYSL